jgi:hypothetical protein
MKLWHCTLIGAAGAAAFLIATHARGVERFPGQYAQVDPEISDWYRGQLVPGGQSRGQSCCSQADGTKAESDVRPGHDGELHWFAKFEACFYPGNNLPKVCRNIDWMEVPDEAIIEHSRNPTGSTVVWYSANFDYATQAIGEVKIRCFARESEI